MSSPHPCTVALVGAGRMGQQHARAFADVPGVKLVGVQSRTRARTERFANELGIPTVCDSVPELYGTTRADVVVVAVPEVMINTVSRACCEFPWTVLLEKPPGLDVPDAEDIAMAARAHQRRVLVALNRRFLSSTQAVLAGLANHDAPRFITVLDQEDQIQARAIGHPEVVVEKWMYANSIHLVDYFLMFGRGEMVSVQPIVRWDPQQPGVVVGLVTFSSGDLGLYEAIWNGPGPWAVSVATTETRWDMRPLEHATAQFAGQRQRQELPVHPWDHTFKPGFRLQAEQVVAAALDRPSTVPTLEESLNTMRLIHGLYGPQPVTLPLDRGGATTTHAVSCR